ncbi:unnamed protein product [Discula destructiva]
MKKLPVTIPKLTRTTAPSTLSPTATGAIAGTRRSFQHQQEASSHQAMTRGWDEWRQRCSHEIQTLRQQMHVAAADKAGSAADQRPVERRLA